MYVKDWYCAFFSPVNPLTHSLRTFRFTCHKIHIGLNELGYAILVKLFLHFVLHCNISRPKTSVATVAELFITVKALMDAGTNVLSAPQVHI